MSEPQRILIVEDEPLIAMMLEDFIEALGKRVGGNVDTVAAALRLIEAGGIDSAILDINLRGGEKCWPVADALAARGLPFIFASGDSDDAIEARYRGRPVLLKPFTMDAIARSLDQLPATER